MSPLAPSFERFSLEKRLVERPTNPDGLVLEAWAQGYMVGSLIVMSCITMANMRKGAVLHKVSLQAYAQFRKSYVSATNVVLSQLILLEVRAILEP
jgi:hypothetical protein